MMKKLILIFLFIPLFLVAGGQTNMDHNTRANYILDVAKYVKWEYPGFDSLVDFNIGVLTRETDFLFEFRRVIKTRDHLHEKRVVLKHFREIEDVDDVQVLFVMDEEQYKIKNINKQIEGKHTLLITEGFEFQKSMINFVMLDGRPRFEANQAKLEAENLKVPHLFLAQAIKTREDWEELYQVTDIALDEEKQLTAEQKEVIARQKEEIDQLAKEIEKQKKHLVQLNAEIAARQSELEEKNRFLAIKEQDLRKKTAELERKNKEVKAKAAVLRQKEAEIKEKNREIDKQERKIATQNSKINEQLAEIEKQKIVLAALLLVVGLFIFLAYFIYRAYKIKKEANRALEQKNKTISVQKDQIEKERDVIKSQRDQIAYQKKHITDSIEYAKRIQTALIPSIELFSDKIDHFVLWKPRDIVSGDFYWNHVVNDVLIIVAADCTGHGVPGAFMSMLGVSLLNEIVVNKGVIEPNEVLEELREAIIATLDQDDDASEVKDGMDMTICSIHQESNTLKFAGANNPLYIFRKGELTEIKGDKMPVAIYKRMNPYQIHEWKLEKGDTFYIFSDGFVDQFGGPSHKKFLSKNFKKLLAELQGFSMIEQARKLDEVFEDWKSDVTQLDDVCVIGIRY